MDLYPALPSRALAPGARLCRPALSGPEATAESPALSVMTDLTRIAPVVISADTTMEWANTYMIQRGVRMLFAMHADGTLAGIVTATDILGEKPVELVHQERVRYADIRVSDVMTPAARIEVLDYARVERSQVGHVVSTMQAARRHHALVVQQDAQGRTEIRGIFSLSQVARQLGMPLQLPQEVETFSEIEAAIGAA